MKVEIVCQEKSTVELPQIEYYGYPDKKGTVGRTGVSASQNPI
jgi:hypothetical protein